MKELMGIINLSENEENIKELTYNRSLATIPIMGRYRIIDFMLSNMVNSGIQKVSIITKGKSRSLMDHIKTGKSWGLDKKINGLTVLNPVVNLYDFVTHKGDLECFKSHYDFFEHSKQKYVFLSRSYMICNIDFKDALKYHKESGADITIIYKKILNNDDRFLNCDNLNLDDDNRVISIGRNTKIRRSSNVSMEMYIMKKELLLNIIHDSLILGDSEYLKQAVFQKIKSSYVNAYEFEGYLSCINSVQNYYETSMELLDRNLSNELFDQNGTIYTKVKDEPPAKYVEGSKVSNSLIANGCIIEGTVENSILGRSVKIKKGVVVKNSIIMQKSTIEEGTFVDNAIVDKYVQISPQSILSGDRRNPIIIKKGSRL